jgi:ectoine hydroxylase-related dioxygenase (phytanoyl-CoA dioxygenase family)
VIGSLCVDGFCIAPVAVDETVVANLIAAMDGADINRSKRGDAIFGARNLLNVPEISAFANSTVVTALVQPVLGPGATPVRGIFFDKTPGANWPVAWHQDLTLAVTRRIEIDGWTNWTVKGGSHHVNPPVSILESMVTLRVMLDDCDTENGPLRVIPGSHRLGRLSRDRIVKECASREERECLGCAGDVLMMRPLLLHASSAARRASHRRVIHLEFAAQGAIPVGLLN